jgi:hypothetical protein
MQLTWNSRELKPLWSIRSVVENIYRQVFQLLPPEAMGNKTKNKQTKILRRKASEWHVMRKRDFEKFQNIPVSPGDNVHAQGCVHTQERPQKALCSYLWVTMKLCADKKSR